MKKSKNIIWIGSWILYLEQRLYSGVILVMTTNKPLEYFTLLDPSLMWEGRVNIIYQI